MITAPRSQHVSDPLLAPFLSSSFSATDYLNETLPPLRTLAPSSSLQTTSNLSGTLSLSDLTAQTQSHITQLSAQTTRLTANLTQLTDDILRSGSRLAYEVEVLRGEALSLNDTLVEKLQPQIEKVAPASNRNPASTNGKDVEQARNGTLAKTTNGDDATLHSGSAVGTEGNIPPSEATLPPAIKHLQTLHQVRTRLHSIIATFDAALNWPLPPSLLQQSQGQSLSLPSSLISVSAPTPPPPSDDYSRSTAGRDRISNAASTEEQGQEALSRIRREIVESLELGGEEGILAAEKRIEELRVLVGVWRGTVEERAREKIVEGFEEAVWERRRAWEEGRGGRSGDDFERESGAGGTRSESVQGRERGQGGFLRRLRDEIYLE
ncbi:hypothetical protein MMC25_007935 [Agyrium rufum]|nr:hypothetical protein [Agyrium rufum]